MTPLRGSVTPRRHGPNAIFRAFRIWRGWRARARTAKTRQSAPVTVPRCSSREGHDEAKDSLGPCAQRLPSIRQASTSAHEPAGGAAAQRNPPRMRATRPQAIQVNFSILSPIRHETAVGTRLCDCTTARTKSRSGSNEGESFTLHTKIRGRVSFLSPVFSEFPVLYSPYRLTQLLLRTQLRRMTVARA